MELRKTAVAAGVVFAAAGLLAGCSVVERTSADRFTASGELVALSGGDAGAAFACITCHGLDGMGNGAGAPRLAGLERGYLERQLADYANGLRRHPEMAHLARRLSWRERQSVAAYYAVLPVAPGGGTPQRVPQLWSAGDPGRGLQPCADCHGPLGEGVGSGNPALGRQPAPYLAAQLHQWRRGERRNDPGNVMLEISRRLTAREITTLAAYAGALPAGPPRRVSREAFPAARRDDPRNGASGQRPHEAAR